MFIIVNIILILLAALIAYWWANQGFFSAFLHMICVIVAGTIALAFWEPLLYALVSGRGSDGLLTGASLLVPFCVVLIVIRVSADKLAPSNISIPQWANLTFGGLAGAVAAVITIGFLVIGLGHMQARTSIMAFNGYQRNTSQKSQLGVVDQLWVPFHTITTGFYEFLSVGSMRSGTPLAQYTPYLDRQATLLRDSYDQGTGSVSMRPSGAEVTSISYDPNQDTRIFVTVNFNREGLDFGTQLTLSSAQIRLIGTPLRNRDRAETVHPVGWWQPHTNDSGLGYFKFDSTSHYMSSKPGQNDTTGAVFEFLAPSADFTPRYIQIKGVRYTLPTENFAAAGDRLIARMSSQFEDVQVFEGQNIQAAITINNSSRTFNINQSRNNRSPGLTLNDERYITSTSGEVEMIKGSRIRSANAIKGVFEPEGTRWSSGLS